MRSPLPNQRKILLATLISTLVHGVAHAEEPALEVIVVTAPPGTDDRPLAATLVDEQSLRALTSATSDTASLIREVPGVSLYGAGGVSSLPAIHGLADDRLRVTVDGMDLIASCPNHMNPALSYVDPSQIESLKVYAGITPVSVGGDSIGGTIAAETREPEFARPGEGTLTKGELGLFYRSNGNARGGNVAATLANDRFSLSYRGASAKSDNYDAGGDFKNFTATGRPGHALDPSEVGSTAYETRNHLLDFAVRGGNHLIDLTLGFQDVPEQLYPNQRMDMLDNEEKRANLRYHGQFDWGNLEARAYHEKIDHFMDFGPDKQLIYGTLPDLNNPAILYTVAGMPMYTGSTTNGLSLQGEIDLSERDLLRVGGMLQTYRLDDWWPPAPDCGVGNCIGGMAPLTLWNINDGQRDRKALYAEWEAKWNPRWTSLLGLRVEGVTTDAGPVSGYTDMTLPGATNLTRMGMPFGLMYASSSVAAMPAGRDAFNALDRERSDTNWDFTALSSYRSSDTFDLQFGVARKTRSPNLYERYSWSTNSMAMVMNNFVGDGNGYVGNPDLDPEVAHTLSVSGDWHSADREYRLAVTPYYTHVDDYIDARRTYPGSATTNVSATDSFVRLQYVNQQARLYGVDVSGRMPLAKTSMGAFGLRGVLSYVNGRNTDTDDGLYNIMPLNTRLTLTHHIGAWDNALELALVGAKDDVSDLRDEIKTPGYGLVNLRGSYSWKRARLDFGVENLLDKSYSLPTGGAYVGQGMTMSILGTPWGIAVPGPGRSLYAGVTFEF
ncbi:TonB-dependent receptor [Endothiovibrio diazotrophicus]